MDDLLQWLGEQLAEDERIVRENSDGNGLADGFPDYRTYSDSDTAAADEYIEHFGPERMLREIEAKRELVERHERAMENRRSHPDDLASAGALLALHGAVKLLTLPYADRPGYRDEWRP